MLWNERVAILGIDCNMSFYTLVGIIASILRTAAIFDTLTSTKKRSCGILLYGHRSTFFSIDEKTGSILLIPDTKICINPLYAAMLFFV